MRDLDLAEGRRLLARADYFNCYSGHPNAVAASDWLRLHATALLDLADLAERAEKAEAEQDLERHSLGRRWREERSGRLAALDELDALKRSLSKAVDRGIRAEAERDALRAECNEWEATAKNMELAMDALCLEVERLRGRPYAVCAKCGIERKGHKRRHRFVEPK